MKTTGKIQRIYLVTLLGVIIPIFFSSYVVFAEDKGSESGAGTDMKLQKRIDFESAYIIGQSIKSGAVYLLHRKQSEIKSMLEIRTDYREEILENFNCNDLVVKEKPDAEDKKNALGETVASQSEKITEKK